MKKIKMVSTKGDIILSFPDYMLEIMETIVPKIKFEITRVVDSGGDEIYNFTKSNERR